MTSPLFAPTDRAALDEAVSQVTLPDASVRTIEPAIDRWRRVLDAIEEGYEFSIYDYMNDLGARDVLQRTEEVANGTAKQRLSKALAALDSRFVDLTEPAVRPLSTTKPTASIWWRRIPRKLIGELAEDLRDEGLLRLPPQV